MPFRFRAQSALDLRRREDERAKRALGAARQEVAAAASAVAAAETRLADGLRRARDEQLQATDTMMSSWLRNWATGQRREAWPSSGAGHAAGGGAISRGAPDGSHAARARTRSLRDRMWHEHALEERRAEQRE